MKRILLLVVCLLQFVTTSAWAESFVVKSIQVQGLERVSQATVEKYLPIKRGQTLTNAKTARIVAALYKTGFYDRISLARDHNTLVIHVVERPVIGQLKISGNSTIPTDKLTAVMKQLDIAPGRIYNAATLEKIKQSLLNQYYMLGRYNARVDILTAPMSRNRVSVKVAISEGLVAKVKRISIIGNKAFAESTLLKQLDVETAGILNYFSQSDRYSEEKLQLSVEKLRNYYLDHGYLRVQVKSSQAAVTPDRKVVYISFIVDEGKPYKIAGITMSGQTVIAHDKLLAQSGIKAGQEFSRKRLIDSEKTITRLLGEKGYMFATITLQPKVNDAEQKVVLNFAVKQGKRTYVRHIGFSNNTRTNDLVLRREIQQLESAPASTTKLEDSKHRLLLLPYIKNVDMTVLPVPNETDQVDVNYKVKEDNSARASLNIGYSQIDGTIFGAGWNQKNFFGTGNTLGINFNRSKVQQNYGIDYTDPYYTEDGISRSLSFAVSRVDPGNTSNVNSGYTMNEYDLGVLYGIPVGQEESIFNRLFAGAYYQDTLIHLQNSGISNQIYDFIGRHGRRFRQIDIKLGFSRDSRDRDIFPTKGTQQSIFLDTYLPAARNALTFYMLNYQAKWYQPLYEDFIMLSKANFGYGNGRHGIHDYPFYKNYFAGGIDTVRGYQGYTLGPQDSNGKAFGGNMLLNASVGLIFPNYLSDNLRTMAFVDAGNVYTGLNNRSYGGASTMSGPVRYSVGLEADWLTPIGPVELSLAKPFLKKGDQAEYFQFALGANF